MGRGREEKQALRSENIERVGETRVESVRMKWTED